MLCGFFIVQKNAFELSQIVDHALIPLPADRQVLQLFQLFPLPVADHWLHRVPHGGRRVLQEAVDRLDGLGGLGGLRGPLGGGWAARDGAAGKVLQAQTPAATFRR